MIAITLQKASAAILNDEGHATIPLTNTDIAFMFLTVLAVVAAPFLGGF